MTAKVIQLQVKPGIQRDGTQFAAPTYVDGEWVRFQNALPRKIGGYKGIFLNASGISRGMTMTSENGINYVVSGYNLGVEQWYTDNDDGLGFGPVPYVMTGGIVSIQIVNSGNGSYTNGTYTAVPLTGGTGSSAQATIVISGNLITNVTITAAGTGYTVGDILSASSASIGGTGSGFSMLLTANTVFTGGNKTLWQFDIGYDSSGGSTSNLIAHPGQNLSAIDSTVNTKPLIGQFPGTTLATVGVFSVASCYLNGSTIIINGANYLVGNGQTISGTGITTGTTITNTDVVANVTFTGYTVGTTLTVTAANDGSLTVGQTIIGGVGVGVLPNTTITARGTGIGGIGTYTINNSQTIGAVGTPAAFSGSATTTLTTSASMTTGTITVTFDNNISVSGGIVMLHPYLFVYGNNGLIQNSAAGDFSNWVSADANANNVSTGKIVKGLPLRGGTTSPAGLFWSLDSLVRVTYAPSTVNGISFYWKYDLLTSQTSIMSSQCVIEYDGIFYWCAVDRFLSYNGVVQEIPNTLNQNYFFDNLNYAQRQKVWCTKVPRWGEIWWFYPRGDATECTDAVIYNVREKTWYDAGEAVGARRSAGTFSEVFRKPIWAGNIVNTTGKYTLWQHESGSDEVYTTNVNAIRSSFTTNNLGWVTGGPGNPQLSGDNRWLRLERVEPDFVQTGDMSLYVTGQGYADDTDQISDAYVFDKTTLKIDMREQRRLLRLKFESNTFNGDYYMGKVLLSADQGDERSTGNP
jgi:hypothetical protein